MVEVSVIMPAYNTAGYIAESLDSVFAQTYRNFEVLVINDGSPDTEELEKVLQPYRDRIKYLKQPNRGLSAARNAGIRKAQAEFLALLDSDDLWEPDCLSEQMEFLASDPSLDMVYCDTLFFGQTPADGMRYTSIYPPKTRSVSFESLITWDCAMIFTCCVVAKRRTVVETGLFDETVPYVEDLDLWLRMAHRGAKIAFNPKCLTRRRCRTTAMSKAREKMEHWWAQVLIKASKTLDLSASTRGLIDRQVAQVHAASDLRRGKQYLGEGNIEQAKTSFARANAFFHRAKLSLLLASLRISPGPTQWAARAWQAADTALERARRGFKYRSY